MENVLTGVSGVVMFVIVSVLIGVFVHFYTKKKHDTQGNEIENDFKKVSDVILAVAPASNEIGKVLAESFIPDDNPDKAKYVEIFDGIEHGIDTMNQVKDVLKTTDIKNLPPEQRHEVYQKIAMSSAEGYIKGAGGASPDVISKSVGKMAVDSIYALLKNQKKDSLGNDVTEVTIDVQ